MAKRIRKGEHSELVDKMLGKRLYNPMKVEFVTINEMNQKDTSSGSKTYIFYEMQSSQNSPFVTSGIYQDHALTRQVKYDELSFVTIKFHEGSENGEEVNGLLCLDSTKSFMVPEASVPEASHHQHLSKFCAKGIYTIHGPLSKLSEIVSVHDLNKSFVCSKVITTKDQFTGIYKYGKSKPVKFQTKDSTRGDEVVYKYV